MWKILVGAVLAGSFAVTLTSAQTQTASQPVPSSTNNPSSVPANAPFRNPALPIAERVDDLVSRLTLEEKVSQMRDHATPHPTPRGSEVRLVERGPAWSCFCRLRDEFSSGDRDGCHLGHRPCSQDG